MIMGFFNSYTKEGKGVSKDEVRPIRPIYFFEVLFRKISKFFPLNMLYILLTLPVWLGLCLIVYQANLLIDVNNPDAGIFADAFDLFANVFTLLAVLTGPATAGITYVFKAFSTETPVFVYAEFFEHYKKNFKQSFLLMLINGVFMISTSLTMRSGELYFLRIPSLIFLALLIFVDFYAFSIMVMFKMKFIDILKNSFIFALAKLPLNLFLLIVIGLIILLGAMYPVIMVILLFLVLYAVGGFLVQFSVYPTIEKYMLEPAGKLEEDRDDRDFHE
jgi:uncharacterized membrane protein YesL